MGARRVPGSAQQDFSEKVRVKARPQGRAHVKELVEVEGRMFCAKMFCGGPEARRYGAVQGLIGVRDRRIRNEGRNQKAGIASRSQTAGAEPCKPC